VRCLESGARSRRARRGRARAAGAGRCPPDGGRQPHRRRARGRRPSASAKEVFAVSRPRIPWVVSLALALWAVPRSAFPQPYARFDVPDSTLVGTLAAARADYENRLPVSVDVLEGRGPG